MNQINVIALAFVRQVVSHVSYVSSLNDTNSATLYGRKAVGVEITPSEPIYHQPVLAEASPVSSEEFMRLYFTYISLMFPWFLCLGYTWFYHRARSTWWKIDLAFYTTGFFFFYKDTNFALCWLIITIFRPDYPYMFHVRAFALATTMFVLARNSSQADIELNPGPFEAGEVLQEFINNDMYKEFERTIMLIPFLKSGFKTDSKVTEERHLLERINNDSFYFTTELLFDVHKKTQVTLSGGAFTERVDISRNRFFEDFQLTTLIVSLIAIHNGGYKMSIKRKIAGDLSQNGHSNMPYDFSLPFTSKKSVNFTYVPLHRLEDMSDLVNFQMGQAVSSMKSVGKCSDKISGFVDQVSDMTKPEVFTKIFDGWSETFKSGIRAALISVAIGGTVDFVLTKKRSSFKIALFCSTILIVLEGPDMFNKIVEYCTIDFDSNIDGPQFQSFSSYEGIYSIIGSYFDIKKPDFYRVFNIVSNIDRFTSGFGTIVTFVFDLINRVCEYVINKRPIGDKWLVGITAKRDILEFADEMDAFVHGLNTEGCAVNNSTFVTTINFKRRAEAMMIDKPSAGVANLLSRRLKLLEDLERSLLTTQPGVGELRAEPGSCLLVGAPGTCKSTWSQTLAYALIDRTDKENNLFYRNFGAGYWDGYKNQQVCMYDDLGKHKDVAGVNESEYSELIDLINTGPFPLNMADLKDKGCTFFNSDYVIATSNSRKFMLESLTDPEAVGRRFAGYTFKVVPRADLAIDPTLDTFNQKPDFSKFANNKDGVAQLSIHDFVFVPYDMAEQKDGPERLDIMDLIALIREQRRRNVKIHEANLANIKNILEEIELTKADEDFDSDLKFFQAGEISEMSIVPDEFETQTRELRNMENVDKFTSILEVNGIVKFKESERKNFVHKYISQFGMPSFKNIYLGRFGFQEFANARFLSFKRVKLMTENKLGSFKEAVLEWFKEDKVYSRALAFTGVGGTVLAAIVFTYNFWNSNAMFQDSYSAPVKSKKAWESLGSMRAKTAPIQGRDPYDVNGKNHILSIIDKNSYLLMMNGTTMGTVTAVCGQWFLFSAHFLATLMVRCKDDVTSSHADDILYLRRCSSKHSDVNSWAFTVRELLSNFVENEDMEERDQVLVLMPSRINAHKDIRHMFKFSDKFKERYDGVRRFSVTVDKRNADNVITTLNESQAVFVKNQVLTWKGFKSHCDVYGLRMDNVSGMCGSLYVEINSSLQAGKILGIHSAGYNDSSFCNPVFREDLDRITSFVKDPIMEEAVLYQGEDPFNGRFNIVAEVEPLRTSGKSTFKKSRIYGKVQAPLRAPARLISFTKDEEVIDPAIKSLARYNTVQNQVIPMADYAELVNSEKDFYLGVKLKQCESRVYTFEEAVCGLEDDEFSSLSRSTSCGYPYILTKVKPGKQDFFGDGAEFEFTSEKCHALRKEIDEDIAQMANGVIPKMYFTDCLKDELLPFVKVSEGRTRTFSAGSIKMLILFRMYFGSFMNNYVKNRIRNGSAVGVNVYSAEWDGIALNLTSISQNMNAGDFKGFDTKQSAQMHEAILEIIEDDYPNATEQETEIRFLLWRRIVNSVHVVKGFVVVWDCGLPSGNPMTSIINTMVNRLYHKLCFKDVLNVGPRAFYLFNTEVYLIATGDDCVFAVSEEYEPVFNEYVLGDVFAKFGMVYTPEIKDSVRSSLKRSIEEVSFLKRSWRFESSLNRYLGPMLLEAVLCQLNWTRIREGDQILIDKAHHVVRELSLHGVDVYRKYVPIINENLMKYYGVALQCTSFYVTLEEVLNLQCDFCSFDNTTMTVKPFNRRDSDYLSAHEDNTLKVSELNFPAEACLQADDGAVDVIQQDDGIVDVVQPSSVAVTSKWDRDFVNGDHTSIIKYLGKPVQIQSGSFVSTDGPTTFPLHDWDVPLSKAIMANKMKGIFSIKATLVVTLNVNANQFQQGLYCIAWLPQGGSSDANAQIRWARMHRFSIVQRVQLMQARLNVACDTSVTLRIPFVSCYNSYLYESTRTGACLPGQFFIFPYEPLATAGGSSNAGFTLWAHYEDVKLGMIGSLQMGDLLSDEQIDWLKETKIISKSLKTISNLSTMFVPIPMLSAFAAPLAWATSAASTAANSLGFSKPNQIQEPMRSTRINFPYMGASDGVDVSEPLSMTIGNHVTLDPGRYGTEFDELSIAYLLTKPSYLGSFAWNTGTARGAQICAFSMSPTISKFSQFDGVVPVESVGPMTFVSRWFNLWRGSIYFKFTFVKTPVHSGRLMIAYQLYDDILTTTIASSSLDATDFTHRNIVDIREKTEVTILVPYVSVAEWQETRNDLGAVGVVRVYCLDQLKGPAIVPSEIKIKVEMFGGPDFAFASPRNIDFNPLVAGSIQGGDEQSPEMCRFDLTTIGDVQQPIRTLYAEEATIGESITSLRSNLKRGGMVRVTTVDTNDAETVRVCPFMNTWLRSASFDLPADLETSTRDPYSILSSIYANSGGGMRIKAFSDTRAVSNGTYIVTLDHVNSAASDVLNFAETISQTDADYIANIGNQATIVFNANAPVSGVFIPQNTRTLSRLSSANASNGIVPVNYRKLEADPSQLFIKLMNLDSPDIDKLYFHRAMADDGSFGNFVSIPPRYAP